MRNILCTAHNSALSDIDQAGTSAMTTLEKFLQVRGVRQSRRLRQRAVQCYTVNGLRLERWMLKAMIGFAFEHSTPAGESWRPPLEWVEAAFGRRRLKDGRGLYISDPGATRPALERSELGIQYLTTDGRDLHGAEFNLNGWRMTLSLLPLASEHEYRPSLVYDRDGLATQQVISFDWTTA